MEPYATIDDIVKLAEGLGDAIAAHDAKAGEVKAANEREMLPFAPAPRSVLDQMDLAASLGAAREASGSSTKAADIRGGIGYSIGAKSLEALGAGLVPASPEKQVARTLSRIATPEHEQELATIEARANLHEMLNHDDVLRGHDPHEVARHFNQLSQFAPSLSRKPLMTVPLVRKSIEQGQLDSFDASEAAGAEQKLRQQHQPAAPAPQGGGNGSRSVLG